MPSIKQEHLINIPWMLIFSQCKNHPNKLPSVLLKYSLGSVQLFNMSLKSTRHNEAYGRKILFKNETIEVMLAEWSFQSKASPHNHGGSEGLIWFVAGDFYEQQFHFSERNLKSINKPLFYKENSVVRISQQDIHSCGPDKIGVSLHIYSPPIHQMKVWDQDRQRTLTVADHCGAWIPQDESLILNIQKW